MLRVPQHDTLFILPNTCAIYSIRAPDENIYLVLMKNITLKRTNSSDPNFATLIKELDADLRVRNGLLMDIYDQHNIIDPIETVVIAYLDNEPAGCGCFKVVGDDVIEIKRMFVRQNARGNRISSLVLADLEKWAASLGYKQAVLETGGKQTEALGLYQKSGYERIPNYGPYVELKSSLCFGKPL
jgi:putative acetyltransferase